MKFIVGCGLWIKITFTTYSQTKTPCYEMWCADIDGNRLLCELLLDTSAMNGNSSTVLDCIVGLIYEIIYFIGEKLLQLYAPSVFLDYNTG